jgi:hypothetical protein
MKTLRIAVAAALLLTSGSAFAQSASDVRCLILSNALASQGKDENDKKVGQSSFYFYLGRLGANATAAQLKALADQEGKSITEATANKMMNDCADGVAAKVQMVQSLSGSEKPAAAAPSQRKQPQGR